MRWPLVACKILGRTTAKYRWFAVFYLIISFFVLPATIVALSLAGQTPFLIVGTPAFLVSGRHNSLFVRNVSFFNQGLIRFSYW